MTDGTSAMSGNHPESGPPVDQLSILDVVRQGATLRGLVGPEPVLIVVAARLTDDSVNVVYRTEAGTLGERIVFATDLPNIHAIEAGAAFSFDGDPAAFKLAAEARRMVLSHLFDPQAALGTSDVDPLPHQLRAVYEEMLPRHPLRFILADDPGAGKTIMAGLLIKELIARGDLHRCLIVCPGSLAEQWQDELYRRFHLPFEILTNDKLEAARTGNWFLETNLVIARLDKLSRNEDVQLKLQAPDCRWDLIVCDEAHKMAATFFGG